MWNLFISVLVTVMMWTLATSSTYDDGSGDVDDVTERGYCPKTATFSYLTTCRSCGVNVGVDCPPGSLKVTTGPGHANCSYLSNFGWQDGCHHECVKNYTVTQCCPGFYGSACLPCPGSVKQPCNARGSCDDGNDGTGTCLCQANYTGTSCELCAPGRFGENCQSECQCGKGRCHDGRHGNGSCDCDEGYSGNLCQDVLLGCHNVTCQQNAKCIEDSSGPRCECNIGFHLSNSTCQPINECQQTPGPCHIDALCSPTGPGTSSCDCKRGFQGDGFDCLPINPCDDDTNGGCPSESTVCIYYAPGESRCECQEGFENYIQGQGCSMVDLCQTDENNCHEKATCSMLAPLELQCVCPTDFVGNGTHCYGNILERLEDLHNNDETLRGLLSKTLELFKFGMGSALTKRGPFTVFAVTDRGFRSFLRQNEMSDLMSNQDAARHLVKQHMLVVERTLDQLDNLTIFYTLEGVAAEVRTRRNSGTMKFRLHGSRSSSQAKVVKGDIPASNGVIHVISRFMDNPPIIRGAKSKTLLEQIRHDQRYDKFENLVEKAGVADLLIAPGPLTVFAPSNDALASLPPGTLAFLLSEQGKSKLEVIVKGHIVQRQVLSEDLLDTRQLVTVGYSAHTVSISHLGQIQLNGNVTVTQTDIPASNGYYHHINGLLLPESVLPILPSFCDNITQIKVAGKCAACHMQEFLTCQSPLDQPLERSCCAGFYGAECYPCPGGFQTPCFNRGQCDDGTTGNGACRCKQPYTGTACEICSDPNKYGPNCDQDCTCLHGECDNTVGSNGTCQPNSCARRYGGENCDTQIRICNPYIRLFCHANADCVVLDPENSTTVRDISSTIRRQSRFARCQCRQGYEGSGEACVEVDPCEQLGRGGCHSQAKCTKTGPGRNICECLPGFVGDGRYCFPSTSCNHDNDCHKNATCIKSFTQYECLCKEGFHGNGTDCWVTRDCQENNGGCLSWKVCLQRGPGQVSCNCPERHLRPLNDLTCYDSLAEELLQVDNVTLFQDLIKNIPDEDDFLSDESSNFTVFVPVDEALALFKSRAAYSFWQPTETLLVLLSYHTLEGRYLLEDLEVLPNATELQTMADLEPNKIKVTHSGSRLYINDAQILRGDIAANNGVIHIVDEVLEPFPVSGVEKRLSDLLSSSSQFSIFYSHLERLGVMKMLDERQSYTVFAPIDSAWTTFTGHINKRYLMYYITEDTYSTISMATGHVTTLLGDGVFQVLNISRQAGKLSVNGVQVTVSNIQTESGMVHGIAGLLHPVLNRCDYVNYLRQYVRWCCSNYYGPNCQDCPGGADSACSRRGVCDDGLTGTGTCSCEFGFEGTACDRCQPDVFDNCTVDACEINNGGCDEFADCLTQNGQVTCKCITGYTGDGHTCKSDCTINNGGCHHKAHCSLDFENKKRVCSCHVGYTGDGKQCTSLGKNCSVYHGGCSARATCTDMVKGEVICECLSGYVGNGTVCNGVLLDTLATTHSTVNMYQIIKYLIKQSPNASVIADLLGDSTQSITVFVPQDIRFTTINEDIIYNHMVNKKIYLDKSMRNGSTYLTMNKQSLAITYTKQPAGLIFYINDEKVITANIPATNGIIHIIEGGLDAYTAKVSKVIGSDSPKKKAGLVIGVILTVVLLCGLLVVAVVKLRAKFSSLPPLHQSQSGFGLLEGEEGPGMETPAVPCQSTSFMQPHNLPEFKNPIYKKLSNDDEDDNAEDTIGLFDS